MSQTNKRTSSKRVLDVLEAVILNPETASANQLSSTLDIPLPTIYRQLETLVNEKFISPNPSGNYVAGPRLRTLMLNSLGHEPQVSLRRVILKKLSTDLDETISMSVPHGESLIYFDRFESHWPLQNNVKVGDALPLTCSASGKLYLSTFEKQDALAIFKRIKVSRKAANQITTQKEFATELDRIRECGYAFDNEEWFDGMIGASVPVLNEAGDLCSCLSTHSLTSRKKMSDLESKIPLMQAAAKELGRILLDNEESAPARKNRHAR